MTLYSGDELYGDEITSPREPDSHAESARLAEELGEGTEPADWYRWWGRV